MLLSASPFSDFEVWFCEDCHAYSCAGELPPGCTNHLIFFRSTRSTDGDFYCVDPDIGTQTLVYRWGSIPPSHELVRKSWDWLYANYPTQFVEHWAAVVRRRYLLGRIE